MARLQFNLGVESISASNTEYRLTADLMYFRLTPLKLRTPPIFRAVI